MTTLKNPPASAATVEVWAGALSCAAAVILAAPKRTKQYSVTDTLIDAPLRSPVHQ
jgi:hypothetical protein